MRLQPSRSQYISCRDLERALTLITPASGGVNRDGKTSPSVRPSVPRVAGGSPGASNFFAGAAPPRETGISGAPSPSPARCPPLHRQSAWKRPKRASQRAFRGAARRGGVNDAGARVGVRQSTGLLPAATVQVHVHRLKAGEGGGGVGQSGWERTSGRRTDGPSSSWEVLVQAGERREGGRGENAYGGRGDGRRGVL